MPMRCNFFKSLAPSPIRETREQLRQHILWFLLIRIVLFTLLLSTTLIMQSQGHELIMPPTRYILAFISIVFIYTVGSAAILQRSELSLVRFGTIQLLSDTFFTALVIYGTGCSQSIFAPVFILPIIAGGLILYRISSLVTAAAATLLFGIILLAEYFGHLPFYYHNTVYQPVSSPIISANIFAVYGTTFFVTALLSSMLATRLRTAQEALSETSLQLDRLSLLYKQIFDDINTGIITVDSRDRITSANRAARRITGFEPKEIIGLPFATVFPALQLESSGRHVADLRRKDGNMIRVGYNFSSLHMPADTGDSPCTDCKVITLQDISKIEEMERQMREAEKMAAIGELSASIAHDFRNPLAAISGSAQILAMEANENCNTTIQTLATIIERESARMARTINEFLQFARPAPLQYEWFNLGNLVRECVHQLQQNREEQSAWLIELDIPEHLDGWGDRQQIQCILMHLMENSCAASSETRNPIVVRAGEEKEEGKKIWLEVVDQGSGMDPEIRERIFEPFFTTRENGTGLGLAIVQHIAKNHGGSVEIISSPGQGCTVRIILPLPESSMPEPS
ncbi:two-component system sensor histidine kinase NtrB [Desulfolithobacter sp.]